MAGPVVLKADDDSDGSSTDLVFSDVLEYLIEQVVAFYPELRELVSNSTFPVEAPEDINQLPDLNFIDDLEPMQCAECPVQNGDVFVCFEGLPSGSSYVDYWSNKFPRATDEEEEFDTSSDYVGSILRAVVPWIVIGALAVIVPLTFLCCRHTCCGRLCRCQSRYEKCRESLKDDKCHYWCLICTSILLMASCLAGIIVGLTGSETISVSLTRAVDNSKDKVDALVSDVGQVVVEVDTLVNAVSSISQGVVALGLGASDSLDKIIIEGLELIVEVTEDMSDSTVSLQEEVENIGDDVKEAIDFVNDIDDARNAVFITSIVVICVMGVLVALATCLRHRATTVVVGVLLAIVVLASVAMMVAYIVFGLVAGDGCVTLQRYNERLSISHSKWNIDSIFQEGVFNITSDVALACEPEAAKTLIERHFECPPLPGVLQLYSAGRFVQLMLVIAVDSVMADCLPSEELFSVDNATMACLAAEEQIVTCGEERTAIACDTAVAMSSLSFIFEELIRLLTCEDVADVVDILVVDVCGENMEGIYLSFVGYLLAIVALVSSLYMLIYFLGRYRPRGMADAHKSEETSGHKVVSPLPQLGAPASLKKIEMAATTTVVSADPPQLEAP